MSADTRRLVAVFVVLVGLVAAPFLIDAVRERRRPVLAGARIVTATGSDQVFRTGERRLQLGDEVEIALALRLRQAGRDDRWLAPVPDLEIDGATVDHLSSERWPDADRAVRVFWFSVESAFIGGRLSADNAAERLRYRTYLAPELGRSLVAEGLPAIHSDDHLGGGDGGWPPHAGTIRLYARAELVEATGDLQALQSVSTLDVDRMLEPGFATLYFGHDFGVGLRPGAGELLGLPGFEPEGDTRASRDRVTAGAWGAGFAELVARRLVVSSWTLAAVAVAGVPDLEPERLLDLGSVELSEDRLRRRRRALRWPQDVRPGDLLADDRHWLVLLGDTGDGVLDPSDTVLHCWGRPPERTTLFAALGSDVTRLRHFRLGDPPQ